MTKKTRLAFYKGRKSENRKSLIGDWLICWVIVEFDGDSSEAIAYIRSRVGTPYGWPDLLSFLLPFRVSTPWYFCSKIVALGFKLADAWHKSPGDLYKWAEQQPGFRVLAADEFGLPWTA